MQSAAYLCHWTWQKSVYYSLVTIKEVKKATSPSHGYVAVFAITSDQSSEHDQFKKVGVLKWAHDGCEGCLMVRSDHGPQAEVAQGVGPGPLVEL